MATRSQFFASVSSFRRKHSPNRICRHTNGRHVAVYTAVPLAPVDNESWLARLAVCWLAFPLVNLTIANRSPVFAHLRPAAGIVRSIPPPFAKEASPITAPRYSSYIAVYLLPCAIDAFDVIHRPTRNSAQTTPPASPTTARFACFVSTFGR